MKWNTRWFWEVGWEVEAGETGNSFILLPRVEFVTKSSFHDSPLVKDGSGMFPAHLQRKSCSQN